MEEIIAHLEHSIQDEVLSKSERKDLKALIAEHGLDQDKLNFLRSKIYEIAESRVSEKNYKFIVEWIRSAINATLTMPEVDKSIALFSPGENCREAIMDQINRAVKRIHICVFTISDDAISNAIINAHKKGVAIQIITDNDKTQDLGSDVERIHKTGVSVKIDSTTNHMHHKFMVVDEQILLTGSYNWTLSAAKYNQENILITQENGVVKSFLKEFNRLWNEMETI